MSWPPPDWIPPPGFTQLSFPSSITPTIVSPQLSTATPTQLAELRRQMRVMAKNAARNGSNGLIPGFPMPRNVLFEGDPANDNDDDDDDRDAANVSVAPQGPLGMRLEVKRIDEVYDRTKCEWTTRDSITTSKKDKRDPYGEYVFTIVRKYNPVSADPTMHMITTHLQIKSEYLKKVGLEVIKQVQGISWTSKPLKIDPQILLAWLPQLRDHANAMRKNANVEAASEEEHRLTLTHLDFLIDFLTTENSAVLEELDSLLSHDEITFDLLWAIFVPRTIIYTPCPITSAPRAVRLIFAEQCSRPNGPPYWRLDVEYIDANNNANTKSPRFGLAILPSLEIPAFKGAAKISSLLAYPLKWHPSPDALKKELVERGKKWTGLHGIHHMHYNGTGYHFKEGKHVRINTNSRIMIDWPTFAQIMPNYELPAVLRTVTGEDIDQYGKAHHHNHPHAPRTADEEPLSDSNLLLASPIVYGFSLSDKLWLEFEVDHVETFEWNDEPFENLVLARDQKTLIKTLVESHSSIEEFDDFVEGKGKGLVINLFGNPGVGKSLTAEATSEHVRKPLYVVGAGDLGTSAAALDLNLTRIFNISSGWGAVVLIDEADVFLEERSFHNIERNAMVAVFLRQLEYFRGILFLTTNRVKTFDEAFQSRIHVALRYHDLSPDAKKQIWVAFLKKAALAVGNKGESNLGKKVQGGNGGLSMDELRELGEKKVNGRQIKNVVRTAGALAASRGEEIGYRHLIQVLDMMDQFDASNSMYQ